MEQAITGYIKITNKGEVDVNAFRLMGATTKDETKIGYFGSGNKYALAAALRKNIPFRIFSGEKEVKITTKKTSLRDQDFQLIHVNGAPTSITTNMGRDWETWFIFREFYCNAIDEGEETLGVAGEPVGEKGKTCLYIGMTDEMKKIFDDFPLYFSFKRKPAFTFKGASLFRAMSDLTLCYRKGIRVYAEKQDSIYDYDFADVTIDEARKTSDWNFKYKVINLWKKDATPDMIEELIAKPKSMEFKFDWELGFESMGDGWLQALKGKVIVPNEFGGHFMDDVNDKAVLLPHTLCKELHAAFGNKLRIRGMKSKGKNEFVVVEATEHELAVIKEGTEFLKNFSALRDISSYPVHVAVFENANQYGEAKDDTIYISRTAFELGKRMVVEALLEEYVHLKRKVNDNTREMQTALFQYLVSCIEEKSNKYL